MSKENESTNQNIIDIINKAKGTRSLRAYAEAAGVSAAGLSKIMKGAYKPSIATIKKLTSDDANPQNGVTYHDMLIAAGYEDSDLDQMVSDAVDEQISQMVITERKNKSDASSENTAGRSENDIVRTSIHERMRVFREFETYAIGAIIVALNNAKYSFGINNNEGMMGAPDLDITIENHNVSHWYFEIKMVTENHLKFARHRIRNDIAYLIMRFAPDPTVKVSIVYDNQEVYEYLKRYAGQISYKGELSVICVDREKNRIIGETYLSHYYDDGEEFFIVEEEK